MERPGEKTVEVCTEYDAECLAVGITRDNDVTV
ncbi:hypothetical protein SDC9_165069 [bioreactor metagenome]|uniref:Uncharacterized protein n=1 Tax=bioreactor metagenome TaxID=1076179 RepID=A0A645G0S1_9ZZZZ